MFFNQIRADYRRGDTSLSSHRFPGESEQQWNYRLGRGDADGRQSVDTVYVRGTDGVIRLLSASFDPSLETYDGFLFPDDYSTTALTTTDPHIQSNGKISNGRDRPPLVPVEYSPHANIQLQQNGNNSLGSGNEQSVIRDIRQNSFTEHNSHDQFDPLIDGSEGTDGVDPSPLMLFTSQ